jgi:hypothetical protein
MTRRCFAAVLNVATDEADGMNGNLESLQQSLARLHAQLSAAPTLDAEARALLTEIQRDIERLSRSASPAPVAAPGRTLSPSRQGRLETLAVEFEGEHPSVAAALREIVELLAQAGI